MLLVYEKIEIKEYRSSGKEQYTCHHILHEAIEIVYVTNGNIAIWSGVRAI